VSENRVEEVLSGRHWDLQHRYPTRPRGLRSKTSSTPFDRRYEPSGDEDVGIPLIAQARDGPRNLAWMPWARLRVEDIKEEEEVSRKEGWQKCCPIVTKLLQHRNSARPRGLRNREGTVSLVRSLVVEQGVLVFNVTTGQIPC